MTPTCKRVLTALESAPLGLAATQLAQPNRGGLDWRRRCSDLRKMGYTITAYPIPKKTYMRYVLEGRPS